MDDDWAAYFANYVNETPQKLADLFEECGMAWKYPQGDYPILSVQHPCIELLYAIKGSNNCGKVLTFPDRPDLNRFYVEGMDAAAMMKCLLPFLIRKREMVEGVLRLCDGYIDRCCEKYGYNKAQLGMR